MTVARAMRFAAGRVIIVIAIALLAAADDRIAPMPGVFPDHPAPVPANSFAEYAPEPNPTPGKKDVPWCALNDDRPEPSGGQTTQGRVVHQVGF
jgi:hypothetical protein